MIKKIAIFGAGYVGSSLGVLLAQLFEVVLIDKDLSKVTKINKKQSPLDEPLMQDYFNEKELNLVASDSFKEYLDCELAILALPTNYDAETNFFDTSIIESVLYELNDSVFSGVVVIKSTIPIGFTKRMQELYPNLFIIFVPEFLREGKGLIDNLNPSRIVVGNKNDNAKVIAEIFMSIAENSPPVLFMDSTEAEAVKLFANTYLATRVSFFNELDSFALEHGLNTEDIINGVSTDPRIGEGYNNPSFGYGGYCLPKDTKQLLANYENIPQGIFKSVVESNSLRKNFIAQKILSSNPNIIGIHRLVMKKGSDNFRESAIFDVMQILKNEGKTLIVFEPLLSENRAEFQVTHDLNYFKATSDIILANRMDEELMDIQAKVFTRDIYGEN
jgi:UDPglucose 6-dehydrogenase